MKTRTSTARAWIVTILAVGMTYTLSSAIQDSFGLMWVLGLGIPIILFSMWSAATIVAISED